jgi:uncharacterized protein
VPGVRLLVWRGLEEWLAEAAEVRLADDRLEATGTQLGAEPRPYRVDYELTTGAGWVTERVRLKSGDRSLDLQRAEDGGWTANGEPRPDLADALDCDIQSSPLTNAMPILREGGGPADFVMAWISVPDLEVHASPQRYEPLDDGRVRFVSLDSDFTAELELDEDRLVTRYPRLAERVSSP